MSTTTADSAGTPPMDQLQNRLNDPKVVDGLNRLLDHLDTVSFAVESVDGFIRRSDVIADSVSDTVAEMRDNQPAEAKQLLQKAPEMIRTGTKLADAASDMDVDELARSRLLEKLTEPETLATLNQLLDRLPLAAFLMESLEGFLERGDTIAENLAEAVGDLKLGEAEIDLTQFGPLLESLPRLAEAGDQLLSSDLMGEGLPKVIDAGVDMVHSGMLDKEIVHTLGQLGHQAVETYQEVSSKPQPPVGGLFGTLRAMKDPEVQKSIGFFIAFAKAFSKHLK